MGAKLDVEDDYLVTAIEIRDVDLVKLLMTYGADPLAVLNGRSSSVLDYAKETLAKLAEENKKNQDWVSWMSGKSMSDSEDMKKLKAIIEIFENYRPNQ